MDAQDGRCCRGVRLRGGAGRLCRGRGREPAQLASELTARLVAELPVGFAVGVVAEPVPADDAVFHDRDDRDHDGDGAAHDRDHDRETTETTEATTETAPTTTETTTTATVTTPPPGTGSSTEDSTPWGWIAAAAGLLLAAILIGAWALGRRGAARRAWKATARQAAADGSALHDAALAELIASRTANSPDRWSVIDNAANGVSTSLQRLQAAPPDDQAARTAQTALEQVDAVRSAIAIAHAAPAGLPLDDDAELTLRQRIEGLPAVMRDLSTHGE